VTEERRDWSCGCRVSSRVFPSVGISTVFQLVLHW
jgi:hypothetical protein